MLESYIHVFYENKNKVEKKFRKKNPRPKSFSIFFDRILVEILVGQNFDQNPIQKKSKKVFGRGNFFPKRFFFQLFFVFVKYMNIAFQQAIGRLLTPSGHRERAVCIPNPQILQVAPPRHRILLQPRVGEIFPNPLFCLIFRSIGGVLVVSEC